MQRHLLLGAVILVNWSTQSAPLARQSRSFFGKAVTRNSKTAAQIYENEGKNGLKTYLDRQATRHRTNSIGFFKKDGERVGGNLKLDEIKDLFDKAVRTDKSEFIRFPDKTFAARK